MPLSVQEQYFSRNYMMKIGVGEVVNGTPFFSPEFKNLPLNYVIKSNGGLIKIIHLD